MNTSRWIITGLKMKQDNVLVNALCFFLLLCICMLAGCVSIPEDHLTQGHYRQTGSASGDNLCKSYPDDNKSLPPGRIEKLDSRKFSLMNWNSYKGEGKDWQDDLLRLINGGDILTLQEGYLTAELQEVLQRNSFYWDIATAFLYNQIPSGVLTASRIKPDFLCSFRVKEQFSGIPKTVLFTRYPLARSDNSLLLANIHMVNLSFDTSTYRLQLEKTAEVLAKHQGPIIISGDLNSWSEEREVILNNFVENLNLQTVKFSDDHRTLFLGHPVDHIFYRGLVQLESFTDTVTTSDHNPMLVTFRVADEL